jgi:hypothetical protein
MQHYLEDIRVSDEDTYITDGDKELTTAEISSGFWSCGFDRDGTCFEMTKISRATAKDYMFDYGAYSLKDLTVTDFGDAVYYYNEETCDGGILLVH